MKIKILPALTLLIAHNLLSMEQESQSSSLTTNQEKAIEINAERQKFLKLLKEKPISELPSLPPKKFSSSIANIIDLIQSGAVVVLHQNFEKSRTFYNGKELDIKAVRIILVNLPKRPDLLNDGEWNYIIKSHFGPAVEITGHALDKTILNFIERDIHSKKNIHG